MSRQVIAFRELFHENGQRVVLEVAEAQRQADGVWECEVRLAGIANPKTRSIPGDDSIQATKHAIEIGEDMLNTCQECRAGKLFYGDGSRYSARRSKFRCHRRAP